MSAEWFAGIQDSWIPAQSSFSVFVPALQITGPGWTFDLKMAGTKAMFYARGGPYERQIDDTGLSGWLSSITTPER